MTNQPTREDTMSDNMFADCETAEAVLARYRLSATPHNPKQFRADALVRIAELSPRTVDAAGRERALDILRKVEWEATPKVLDEIIDALGWTATKPDPAVHGIGCGCLSCLEWIKLSEPTPRTVDAAGRERVREIVSGWVDGMQCHAVTDRIINALGWTAAEVDPDADPELKPGEVAPDWSKLLRRDLVVDPEPTPAPATPAVELDVTALERIRAVLNCHENLRGAMDKLPMFGDMSDIPIPGNLPMRITTDDNGVSVLRIDGGDE